MLPRINQHSDRLEPAFAPNDPCPEVSIVVPLFNEAETLQDLSDQIFRALDGTDLEILFVDDGSTDQSWEIIQELTTRYPEQIRAVRHRRNFGKADALTTGFEQAQGNYIVTIDADLQDDPAEIPNLIAKLKDGYDLVSGWKRRRHDPLNKTLPSRLFNLTTSFVSGIKLHDFNCGLKAYRAESLTDLHLYGELHRFIPILIHADGFRVTEIPVQHHPRTHGKSKYGWQRLFKGGLDLLTVVLLTRYLKRPGHFFGAIGLVSGSIGLGILAFLSVSKIFFGIDIGPRPLFFFGILATLFSAQLISTGIIGEFLLRLNGSTQRKAQIAERLD